MQKAAAAGVADDAFRCGRDGDGFVRAGARMFAALRDDPRVLDLLATAAAGGGAGGGGGDGGHQQQQPPQPAAAAAAARQLLDARLAASPALAALAGVWRAAAAKRAAWRGSRAEMVARVSAARCAAARPLYGRDLVAAVTAGVHPVAACLARAQRLTPRGGVWRDAVTAPPDAAAAARAVPADFEPPSASAAAAAAEAARGAPGAFGRYGANGAGCGGSAYAALAGAEGLGWWAGLAPGALRDAPDLVLQLTACAVTRAAAAEPLLREFVCAVPPVRAEPPELVCARPDAAALRRAAEAAAVARREWGARAGPLRTALVRRQLFFPDRRLLQFDCGKLQELAVLLRRLKAGGHRVLIFTQVCARCDGGWSGGG